MEEQYSLNCQTLYILTVPSRTGNGLLDFDLRICISEEDGEKYVIFINEEICLERFCISKKEYKEMVTFYIKKSKELSIEIEKIKKEKINELFHNYLNQFGLCC